MEYKVIYNSISGLKEKLFDGFFEAMEFQELFGGELYIKRCGDCNWEKP